MARNGERDGSRFSVVDDPYFRNSHENHIITPAQIEEFSKDSVKRRNARNHILVAGGYLQISEKAVAARASLPLHEHNSLHHDLDGIDRLIEAYQQAKADGTLSSKLKRKKNPSQEKIDIKKALRTSNEKLPESLKGELVDHT